MTQRRAHGDSGAISTAALVAAVVAVAVVVGLIAGAVWGLAGSSHGPTPAPTTASPSPTTPSPAPTTGSPSPAPTSASPQPTSTTPAPSPTGSAPPAPATTSTVVPGWRLGAWKITNTGGTLGVDTTARNTGTATAGASFVLYVYVDGALIATTFATVTDVPAGGSVPVHFAGSDPWKPGTKILLLQLA